MNSIKEKLLFPIIYLFKMGATIPHMNYYLFIDDKGNSFNGNQKIIFEYMLQKYPMRKYVWAFKDKKQIIAFKEKYPQCHAVKYNSIRLCFYLQKSRYWIFNFVTPNYFKISKYTFYLQTSDDLNIIDEDKDKLDYLFTKDEESKNKLIEEYKIKEKKIIISDYPINEQGNVNWEEIDKILCQ
ncbi:MAG: CDP-glycerol glycerophosphotransferase family protein [Bacilli bacterium]|jgi:CDP-glycerol glycerophosphotransferase (TagB/SpsB family)|nr:CDP-glycerol glycerophosphotransferase family protein [Bacilli bacterium]